MLKKCVIAITLILAVLSVPMPALASDYHENPETVRVIYNSIALLRYYAASLDPVIEQNPVSSENMLGHIPLTNIPEQLNQYTTDFVASGIALSYSIATLFQIWDQQNTLVRQQRLDEAAELSGQINSRLPKAYGELAKLTLSVKNTGLFLRVNPAATDNQLTRTYNEVMEKVQRLEEMLDLLSRPLISLEASQGLFNQTTLTFTINPLTAFVGETVSFNGALSSREEPLGGRDIEILLNSTLHLTVTTDTQGRFQGQLQVPYWYNPGLAAQAIYYPRDEDLSTYLRAASPVVAIKVLYYAARLTIQAAGPAYPGKEAAIKGDFDYGQATAIDRKAAELYLDDALITHFTAQPHFTRNIFLKPETSLSGHTLTVAVPPEGRYAPVNASCSVEVIQAAVALDLQAPTIGLVPGNLELSGKLNSKLGPLSEAIIKLKMGETQAQVTSSPAGNFRADLQMGPALSLIGSQAVAIKIQPQEPWNAPLSATRNIFVINILNCGLLLIVLLVIGFYLPRRFKKWFRGYGGKTPAPVESAPPGFEPVYEIQTTTDSAILSEADANKPGSIFDLYRFILKLVQAMTKIFLKPQQTLREYARENSQPLGAPGKYFIEFTLLVERFLYSKQKPAQADIERGQQLSQAIKGGQK